MLIKEVKETLLAAFPDAKVDFLGDDGAHFELSIGSQAFQGKSTLEQHRMVMKILKPFLEKDLHAVALTTFVPKALS